MTARLFLTAAAIGLGLWVNAASADVKVTFVEGAPKDRFVIENLGNCSLTSETLKLNLASSQGKLIFDVTALGQGVEVFQPFEVVEGADFLAEMPSVIDGQRELSLQIEQLPQGGSIAFTIDVDDTISAREITVTDAEIMGATIAMGESELRTASFTNIATATLATMC